jgi:OOP family OmpA-OmpF porin
MKLIPGSFIALAALTAISAHAEGLYIGGNVGASRYQGDAIDGASITGRSGTGVKVYGGYSFTPNLALESGYVDLGKFNTSTGHVKGDGLFLDAVGTLPLADSFSALGRVGVFNGKLSSDADGSGSGTSYKFGAGLQYDINPNVALRGEWERYRFDALNTKPNTDMLSVGVAYRF